MTCSCDVCNNIAGFREVLENDDINVIRDYLRDTFDRMLDAENELEYYKALVQGTFPNADEVTARARKRYINNKK